MKPSGRPSLPSRLWLRLAVAPVAATLAAAAPADTPAAEAPPPDVEELVRQLSHDDYRTREAATLELWKLGPSVLPELNEAAESREPETVHRALELIRKIDLHITPATDPQVLELIDRYSRANRRLRNDIFVQLHHLGAWRQMLRLFALEQDQELRGQVQRMVEQVALQAARERIIEGDPAGAREALELAPANPQSMLALADFHRLNGTWEDKLAEAERLDTPAGAAWRLALHRAAGNAAEAAAAAEQAGQPRIAAFQAALAGDPLPWLTEHADSGGAAVYSDLAIRRWRGEALGEDDLAPLLRALGRNNPEERLVAAKHLFLLGEPAAPEADLAQISSTIAFLHFTSLERLDEAFAAIGIDPEDPDLAAWIGEKLERFVQQPDDPGALEEVVWMSAFAEERGLAEAIAASLREPAARLAEHSPAAFGEFLSMLFGNPTLQNGAPLTATRVAEAWAGDNEASWKEVRVAAFSENPRIEDYWKWLGELDPDASRRDRFRGLAALCNLGKDPGNHRQRWLDLAWRQVDGAEGDAREAALEQILSLTNFHEDATTFIRAWELLPEERQKEYEGQQLVDRLVAVGRFREAADRVVAALAASGKAAPEQAYAAGMLRLAGRDSAAKEHDQLAERLALGDPGTAGEIAAGYARASDFANFEIWSLRALEWSDPEEIFRIPDGAALPHVITGAELLLEAGDWERSAALSEIVAHVYASETIRPDAGASLLRTRGNGDLARAMSLLGTDRKRALALLGKTHANLAADGTLADHFFPVVREADLADHYDTWFEKSWEQLGESLSLYPDSDNTLNTAGWIAGRAARRLPEAEAMMEKALAIRPNQPAYLDTLAEIHFAAGRRKEAVRWGALAVNFGRADDAASPMIRKQFQRFQTAPLPR